MIFRVELLIYQRVLVITLELQMTNYIEYGIDVLGIKMKIKMKKNKMMMIIIIIMMKFITMFHVCISLMQPLFEL